MGDAGERGPPGPDGGEVRILCPLVNSNILFCVLHVSSLSTFLNSFSVALLSQLALSLISDYGIDHKSEVWA